MVLGIGELTRHLTNKIWDKIGYKSACKRDISEIHAPCRRFSSLGY